MVLRGVSAGVMAEEGALARYHASTFQLTRGFTSPGDCARRVELQSTPVGVLKLQCPDIVNDETILNIRSPFLKGESSEQLISGLI